jgi:ATP-binding protein involved in chromosome partitioning
MTDDKSCDSCNDSQCQAKQKRPGEKDADFAERQLLESRMCRIRHKVMVLSGKGGVGKSTVAANLATALVMTGHRVGLLDVDIHGPSIPKLLNIEDVPVSGSGHTLLPAEIGRGLKVMSIGLLLQNRDDAVIWRGPMKYKAIKQFLTDVEWGELDYLVVDSPPGTGDEPLSVAQLIPKADGAVIVTTPQALAVQDVRRCIVFCRQIEVPVLGVIENMSGLVCPHCGERVAVFGSGGGEAMAKDMRVPFLGAIPIDPQVVSACDAGRSVMESMAGSETAPAFDRIIQQLVERIGGAA